MNTSEQQLMSYRKSRGSLFTRLRSYFFFVPVVYLYTAVMGTLSLLASLFDGTGRVQHWFAHTWSRMILATVRVRVQVEGWEHIDPSRAAIYAANHLSAMDIPVLVRVPAAAVSHPGEEGAVSLSVSGLVPDALGADSDCYGDPHASLRSLNRASDSLRKGTPLVVFPEGGRSEIGHLRPFMGGAFYVAIRAQAPVVPVALVGTYELLPINSFHVLPGKVEMIIGEPIPTTGLRVRDMEKLAAQVRQVVEEMYYSRAKIALPAENGEEESGGW